LPASSPLTRRRLHQRQQRVGGQRGIGNDLVSDPPVQLDDIFSLVVTREIGIEHGKCA
jgi:hypothetical protein